MADIDLKTETPDTSLPSTGFLFGADSQSAASPSVYSTQAVATALLGSTSLTGATVTANAPVLNMAQTWNNSGVTFTGLKFNVPTDSSAAGSLLMDLQVGGSSRVAIKKNGDVATPGKIFGASFAAGYFDPNSGSGAVVGFSGGSFMAVGTSSLALAAARVDIGGSNDLFLSRRAAANLRLGAADAAGSAIAINSVATNQLTLASNHGLTTGAAVIITGTAAPSGTSLNTRYYARVISAAVIELYSTYDQATAASGATGRISVTTAGTSAFVNLATPFQSFGVQDFTGTDIPGQPFVIRGSRGTGTGPGGDLIFQVAPAGTAESVQNALATALTIDSTRRATFASGITVNGGVTATAFAGGGVSIDGSTVYGSGIKIGWSAAPAWGAVAEVNLANSGFVGWGNGSSTIDTILARDNPGVLALRNGANAQTFRVYNTTDGTNFERFSLSWVSNAMELTMEKGGTGANRDARFVLTGALALATSSSSNDIAYIGSSSFGLASAVGIRWASGTNAGSGHDVSIGRSAAGVLAVRDGISPLSSAGGAAIELKEQTAPAAPAANAVRIYAEDNGSGKTRLMALFATGAAVQIAVEP